MKIKVYKSINGLDIDETYETTLIELLYFLRINTYSQIPKPNEKFIFLRKATGPVQMWYEILESKGDE